MHSGAFVALAYLAIVQTAIAFSLWYSAVGILGPAIAGLFAGLMPIAAALTVNPSAQMRMARPNKMKQRTRPGKETLSSAFYGGISVI